MAESDLPKQRIDHWKSLLSKYSSRLGSPEDLGVPPLHVSLARWVGAGRPEDKKKFLEEIKKDPQTAQEIEHVAQSILKKEMGETLGVDGVILFRALREVSGQWVAIGPFDSLSADYDLTRRAFAERHNGGFSPVLGFEVPPENIFTYWKAHPAFNPRQVEKEYILSERGLAGVRLASVDHKYPTASEAQKLKELMPDLIIEPGEAETYNDLHEDYLSWRSRKQRDLSWIVEMFTLGNSKGKTEQNTLAKRKELAWIYLFSLSLARRIFQVPLGVAGEPPLVVFDEEMSGGEAAYVELPGNDGENSRFIVFSQGALNELSGEFKNDIFVTNPESFAYFIGVSIEEIAHFVWSKLAWQGNSGEKERTGKLYQEAYDGIQQVRAEILASGENFNGDKDELEELRVRALQAQLNYNTAPIEFMGFSWRRIIGNRFLSWSKEYKAVSADYKRAIDHKRRNRKQHS